MLWKSMKMAASTRRQLLHDLFQCGAWCLFGWLEAEARKFQASQFSQQVHMELLNCSEVFQSSPSECSELPSSPSSSNCFFCFS